jgi:hypothetical protein
MQELQALDQAVKAADQARYQQPPRRKPQLQLKLRASTVPAANGEYVGIKDGIIFVMQLPREHQ